MSFFSILWEEPFFTGMLIIGAIGMWFAMAYLDLKKKMKDK